ncbi:hypothetical protein DFH09DRAFT_1383942 [Mycena vulgaris]|nr:hypothetical protein DFH09DRAFT_1383942 [Mycena vulgaris]
MPPQHRRVNGTAKKGMMEDGAHDIDHNIDPAFLGTRRSPLPSPSPRTRRHTGPRCAKLRRTAAGTYRPALQSVSTRQRLGAIPPLLTPCGTLSSSVVPPRALGPTTHPSSRACGAAVDRAAAAAAGVHATTAVLRVASMSACIGCGSPPAQRNTCGRSRAYRRLGCALGSRALRRRTI